MSLNMGCHLQRLEQPSVASLVDAVELERGTRGRNLRVLEGRGLVALTAQGKTCLEQASPAWQRVQEQPARRGASARSRRPPCWRCSMTWKRSTDFFR
jgi:hypothetical protein